MESLMHQLRIEQAKSVGYEKNGFAAAVKEVAGAVTEGRWADEAAALIEWISTPPVVRPDAFKIVPEAKTVVALEIVHSHGIKDKKAIWYAKLHDCLIGMGWWLEVEIADAVTGKCQTVPDPYQCWGLMLIMSGSQYDPKAGIDPSAWPQLRAMGLAP